MKSDVTVVFRDQNFVYDAGIPAILDHLRQKLAHLCLHGFSGPFGPKWRFWEQNRGSSGAMLTPTNSFLLLGVVISLPLLAKIDQEMLS